MKTYEEEIAKSDPVKSTAKKPMDENSITYGAFADTILVGVVTLQLETFQKTSHKVNLLAMYVSPEARSQGIGSALLARAIQKAKQVGREQPQLTVVANNQAARTLYSRSGFVECGFEKEALKLENGYVNEVDMVLFLSEAKGKSVLT